MLVQCRHTGTYTILLWAVQHCGVADVAPRKEVLTFFFFCSLFFISFSSCQCQQQRYDYYNDDCNSCYFPVTHSNRLDEDFLMSAALMSAVPEIFIDIYKYL